MERDVLNYTKQDLARKYGKDHKTTIPESLFLIDGFLISFVQFLTSMKSGDRLEIRGFGVFEMHKRPGVLGTRNPQTGEVIPTVSRRRLKYKPSTIIKKALKKLT